MRQYFISVNQSHDFADSSTVSFVYYNGLADVKRTSAALSYHESNDTHSGIGILDSG